MMMCYAPILEIRKHYWIPAYLCKGSFPLTFVGLQFGGKLLSKTQTSSLLLSS